MASWGGPVELLELEDGHVRTFRVERHELGPAVINTTAQPLGKPVERLRVHVPPADKPIFPHYYDVHSKGLVAQLLPHLQRPDVGRLRFTVTARGFGAKKRYQLEVQPL